MSKLKKQIDNYENAMTGLGIEGVDKAKSTRAKWRPLSPQEATRLYASDPIARKVVELIPSDTVREWISYVTTGDEDNNFTNAVSFIDDELMRLNLPEKLMEAQNTARAYGGSIMYISVDDGNELDTELSVDSIRTVNAIHVLDRNVISVNSEDIDTDLSSPRFGLPIFYRVSTGHGEDDYQMIHHSRCIRFDGAYLPLEQFKWNEYWHDSVLTKLQSAIKGYSAAIENLPNLILEANCPVFKINGLAEAVAEDDSMLIQARLRQVQRQRSSLRAVAIDIEDEFGFPPNALSGVKDTIDQLKNYIVSGSGYPETLLLGVSPSASLGSQSGASEHRDYYDNVRVIQNAVVRPAIDRVQELCFAQKNANAPILPDDFSFRFNPLYQQDEKEMIETRKLQAEIDGMYMDRGVYDAVEVAENRLGKKEYSYETALDLTKDRGMPEYEASQETAQEPA